MALLFRFREHAGALMAPGFLILILVSLFSYHNVSIQLRMFDWVDHTHRSLQLLRNVRTALDLAESQRRAYLSSGRRDSLTQTLDGIRTASQKIYEFRLATWDNEAQKSLSERMGWLLEQEIAPLKKALDLEASPRSAAAIQLVKSVNQQLDPIAEPRRLLAAMESEETRLLKIRSSEARLSAEKGMLYILISAGAGLLSLLFAVLMLGRELAAGKRAAREKEVAHQNAVEALEARSAFMANISHEIRTHLHSNIGMSEILASGAAGPPFEKCVDVIRRSGNLLLNLVNDVLDLSKIETGTIDIEYIGYDLHEIVAQAIEIVAFRADHKGLELVYDISPTTPRFLLGDPIRLRQVLLNLLVNAIHFTSTGKVELKIRRTEKSAGSDRLEIEVTDTGGGISAEESEQVFEMLNLLDPDRARNYLGSGLGMTISRRLISLTGVPYVSNPPKGWEPHSLSTYL